jgi:hypothetical protein
MSLSQSVSSTKKSVMGVSPKCSHCSNLGLKNNHWLRKTSDVKSAVICPVLLSTQCLLCNEVGHTSTYCCNKSKKSVVPKRKEKVEMEMDFPVLSVTLNGNKKTNILSVSYSEIASKPPMVLQTTTLNKKDPEPRPLLIKYLGVKKNMASWADDDAWASDDDDNYDNYDNYDKYDKL